jgi:hypothetical protein
MKRITVVVAAASALGVLVGGAGASVSPLVTVAPNARSLGGNSGADVYGVGGGQVDEGFQTFNLSAHEGPNGDFGHVSVTFTNLLGQTIVSYSVNVTCVHIHTLTSSTYDRGVITGVVSRVTPVPNLVGLHTGDRVDFGIKDGGNPSSAPVDDFYAPNAAASATLSCKYFFYTGALSNVTQGNVNIQGP